MFAEDYHIVVLSHGKYLLEQLIVPTIENGEELCIRVCFRFFLLVFLANSGTTKNYRTALSDISYESPNSHD